MTLAADMVTDLATFFSPDDFAVPATLTKGQAIASLAIAAGGTGYTAGTLSATGGGGSGFTGTYAVTAGVITSVVITAGGSGYTSAPTIVISNAGNGNASITPGALTTSTINVIFSAPFSAVSPATGEIETTRPEARCKASDVSTVVHGDTLVISGVTYKVIGKQPSEDGLETVLALSKD